MTEQTPIGLFDVSDDQIAALLREARAEALAEAKVILKERMVQAILAHALGERAGIGDVFTPAGAERASPLGAPDDEDQIRREIAAIRAQIAGNERLLRAARVASPEATPSAIGEPLAPRSPDEVGYYVYGIVASDTDQPIAGLPDQGIDPAYPVYTLKGTGAVPFQALQALVSQVSLQEFGQEELKAHLEDLQWLEARVRVHQGILEAVLAGRTLIPMRFCTIYQSEDRVQEMLAHQHDDFRGILARLAGKQEWGVKVYCDGKTLAQQVGAVSDRVKQLQAEIAQKPSGAAYFLKKKLDEAVAEEVERVGDEVAQRSHDRLSGQATESVVNPLQSKELSSRQEAMVLNGAYLVAQMQLAAFRAELEHLQEEYSSLGFSHEMTGPWPPYNFVAPGLGEGVVDESTGS